MSIVTLVPAVPFGNLLCAAMSGGISIDFDKTFFVQMVLFAAMVPVLKWALFEPILKVFEERERRTDGARAEARTMQEKAGELLRRYEQELQKVSQVAAEERDRLRAETTKLEAEILGEARQVVTRIVADGRGEIDSQVNSIRFELGRQSETLSRQMAERVLGREVR